MYLSMASKTKTIYYPIVNFELIHALLGADHGINEDFPISSCLQGWPPLPCDVRSNDIVDPKSGDFQ